MYHTTTILFILFSLTLSGVCQNATRHIQLIETELELIRQNQHKDLNEAYAFINGKHHLPKILHGSHPYLTNDSWKSGSVMYRKEKHTIDNKKLKYDVFSDNLVYLHLTDSGAFPVELNKAFISRFTLGERQFIYLSDFKNTMFKKFEPGYYEVLYNGSTSLYKKHTKEPVINSSSMKNEYEQRTALLVKKENEYHKINNLLKLTSVLKDERKQLKTFISNRVPMNAGVEDKMIRIVSYYDSIKEAKTVKDE